MIKQTKTKFDDLFPRTYPVKLQQQSDRVSHEESWEAQKSAMQVLVTRSHQGEILVAGADTGQSGLPQRVLGDESHCYHGWPSLGGSSWNTRFDGGYGNNRPGIIIAFYITSEENQSDAGPLYFTPDTIYAKVVIRRKGKKDNVRYMRFGATTLDSVLTDNGLEMMHFILNEVPELGERAFEHPPVPGMPTHIRESLDWSTDHILESFGQGRIPRKRK